MRGIVGKQLRALKGLWTTNYDTPKVTSRVDRRRVLDRVAGEIAGGLNKAKGKARRGR